MKTQRNSLWHLGVMALALIIVSPVFADQHKQTGARPDKELWTEWQSMQEKLVSARDLLAGEMSDGFNPIGRIRDLVMTPNRQQVEYVLYETPFPYSAIDEAQDDGFVAFDETTIERDLGYGLKVRANDDAERGMPERLTLTASEADDRLASNLIGTPLYFAGDDWRRIEDMLIDRDTGQVTHYVINMNRESLFNENPLAVPAEVVELGQDGLITAPMDLAKLAGMQDYDVALL
jgi:hypothetical protein